MGQMIDTTFLSTIKQIGAAHNSKPVLVIGNANGNAAQIIAKLDGIGANVRIEEDLYDGLGEVAVDTSAWSMVVFVADDIGGIKEARRAFGWLRAAAPGLRSLIVSAEVARHVIPDGCRRAAPVVLRAPVSLLSLQLGIDAVMRDRAEAPAPEFA